MSKSMVFNGEGYTYDQNYNPELSSNLLGMIYGNNIIDENNTTLTQFKEDLTND